MDLKIFKHIQLFRIVVSKIVLFRIVDKNHDEDKVEDADNRAQASNVAAFGSIFTLSFRPFLAPSLAHAHTIQYIF